MDLTNIFPVDIETATRLCHAVTHGYAWEVRWVAPSTQLAGRFVECRWKGHSLDVERLADVLSANGFKPKVYADIHAGNHGV